MKLLNGKQIKFSRVGGLSPVKQKGYDPSMPGKHSPPTKKGIYAFLYPYYEPFLLGGVEYSGIKTKHSKFEFIKDKNGNPIEVPFDIDYQHNGSENWMKFWGLHYNGDNKPYYIVKPKKPKVFEYTGELWHHLGKHLKPNEIIGERGTWTLSTFNMYHKAIKKEYSVNKFLRDFGFDGAVNNPFNYICIDHLEVFIEKIK